jgi:hypothetical protein
MSRFGQRPSWRPPFEPPAEVGGSLLTREPVVAARRIVPRLIAEGHHLTTVAELLVPTREPGQAGVGVRAEQGQ